MRPAQVLGHELLDALCKVLGIDSWEVRGMSLDVRPGEIATLTVTRILDAKDLALIAAVLNDPS